MRYEDHLHFVLAVCAVDASGALTLERVDAIIGERFFITAERRPSPLIEGMRKDYRDDFLRFAKTPSFLVYELWDHLAEHYAAVQKILDRKVETLQVELLQALDEAVFRKVSEIGGALLQFRSVLMPARSLSSELSSRKSQFVSEATQAFLGNISQTLERVLQDVLVDRDMLAQALNLSMSMVGHRTNRAMTKLTILSTIFLPLTFLCGVYGKL